MTVHEIQHPRWGSNFDTQLYADFPNRNDGDRTAIYETLTVNRLFFGTKQKKIFVGWESRPTTDDDNVEREFQHRCGLLKIVMTSNRYGALFVAFFDGHVTSEFESEEVEFRIAPDKLESNDGNPLAEVSFWGKGKRRGPLREYRAYRLICTFADKVQMDLYLDVTRRKMPKSITHDGVIYDDTGSGSYQSDNGSILPHLLVLYFLLAPHEQSEFVEKNPDVQTMLATGAQQSSVSDSSDDADGRMTDDVDTVDDDTSDEGGSDAGGEGSD